MAIETKDGRTRNWELVVYPESAPENWQRVLDDLHLCWVESPLHDSDTHEDTGELKKAHFHCILQFAGKKSDDQIKAICDELGHAQFRKVQNMRGAVRYLAHVDNPEKFQYDIDDIQAHGGFDLSTYFEISSKERYEYIREICTFCRETMMVDFPDLMDYAAANHFNTWFRLLCDNSAYVIGQYLKGLRSKLHSDLKGIQNED